MDAANLMNEVSDRISGLDLGDTFKQGQEYVARAADRARDLYRRTEDRLPEGSMKYAGLALAGVAISTVSYRLGKSRTQRLHLRKSAQRVSKIAENARQFADERVSSAREPKIDFTPLYKLAKLWLVYKISL